MILLDSNIIIYAAEPGYDEVREFILQQESAVSVISKVEVLGYHKLRSENQKKLENIFEYLPILPLQNVIVDKAITLRQLRKISLGDALIAATALTNDIASATANTSDFDWIENLDVINPVTKLL